MMQYRETDMLQGKISIYVALLLGKEMYMIRCIMKILTRCPKVSIFDQTSFLSIPIKNISNDYKLIRIWTRYVKQKFGTINVITVD